MAEYCETADVKKRATANGWRYIADRDHDGQISTLEQGEIDAAIQWAGDDIDAALYPRIETDDARGQGVRYLKNIAVDLAVWRLFTNGGDDAPAAIETAYEDAKDKLKRIKGGESVPGLTMTHPRPTNVSARVPRAYMPR